MTYVPIPNKKFHCRTRTRPTDINFIPVLPHNIYTPTFKLPIITWKFFLNKICSNNSNFSTDSFFCIDMLFLFVFSLYTQSFLDKLLLLSCLHTWFSRCWDVFKLRCQRSEFDFHALCHGHTSTLNLLAWNLSVLVNPDTVTINVSLRDTIQSYLYLWRCVKMVEAFSIMIAFVPPIINWLEDCTTRWPVVQILFYEAKLGTWVHTQIALRLRQCLFGHPHTKRTIRLSKIENSV